MDGRESKLTRIIESDPKNREKIKKRYKKGKSVIGLKFKIGDKIYKITDGNLDHLFYKIEKIKQNIINDLKNK